MNQRRGVLALQRATEACRQRSTDLPRALVAELTLRAIGESMRRSHDPRSRTQRELDRIGRELWESPVAIPMHDGLTLEHVRRTRHVIGNPSPDTWLRRSFLDRRVAGRGHA